MAGAGERCKRYYYKILELYSKQAVFLLLCQANTQINTSVVYFYSTACAYANIHQYTIRIVIKEEHLSEALPSLAGGLGRWPLIPGQWGRATVSQTAQSVTAQQSGLGFHYQWLAWHELPHCVTWHSTNSQSTHSTYVSMLSQSSPHSPTCFALHPSPPHSTGASVRSCACPSILTEIDTNCWEEVRFVHHTKH